jgi:hypothetical protein
MMLGRLPHIKADEARELGQMARRTVSGFTHSLTCRRQDGQSSAAYALSAS